jgi:predicted Zn-dependent peptidase
MAILGGSPNEPEIIKKEGASDEEKHQAYLEACAELEELLLAQVAKMKIELVADSELQRIKKLNRRDFIDRMRSNEDLAGTLATLEVQTGWQYLLNYLDKLETVTPEEIRAAANKFFKTDNKTSIYVIPGGKPDQPPESYAEVRSVTGSAAADANLGHDYNNVSIYPTAVGWKHPLSFQRQPEKIIYPQADSIEIGGTKLFYLPDRELPLVDFALLVKTGSVDVDDSKFGLTSMLNDSLIRGGTESYSPAQLAVVLDENAIQISVAVGEEEAVIHLSVLKDDWQAGLNILGEILTRPRFDTRVLDVVKTQELTALKRQGGNAQEVAARERDIWHFKGHPYGRDPLKALQTIPGISREDLKQYLAQYFVPSNMVAAVAGDIDKAEVISGLGQFFEALPQTQAPVRKLADPGKTPPVLALIHKPGQVQSQITLSLPSVKRTHPDYWKISLLTNIFGGDGSLMYKRLRDDLGLVYSAGFYETYKWSAGVLFGYIGCKGDQSVPAIAETVKIMRALGLTVPPKDLDQKRLDALNSFVFNVDTPADLVQVYARYYMRNEPLDTLEKIQDAFFSAKQEDLRRLAAEYLDPDKIQIFLVGDKNIKVKGNQGNESTLEDMLMDLAESLGLPYVELELR